jgi:cell division GTPase FtsZ
MDKKTIAVIGAGNGGFNLIAHLGAAGHAMRLHDIEDAKLTALRAAGGIDTSGMGTGFAKLEHVARVHPQVMWAKFESLAEGARLASNELWGRQAHAGGPG